MALKMPPESHPKPLFKLKYKLARETMKISVRYMRIQVWMWRRRRRRQAGMVCPYIEIGLDRLCCYCKGLNQVPVRIKKLHIHELTKVFVLVLNHLGFEVFF